MNTMSNEERPNRVDGENVPPEFPSIREQLDDVGFDLAGDDYDGDYDDDYDDDYDQPDPYIEGFQDAYNQYAIMRLFFRLKLLRRTLKWKAHDFRRALLRRRFDGSDIPF